MKVEDFKEGEFYVSPKTEIVYRKKKGILYKFPTYAGGIREWSEAGYSGDQTYFTKLTPKQYKDLKPELESRRNNFR